MGENLPSTRRVKTFASESRECDEFIDDGGEDIIAAYTRRSLNVRLQSFQLSRFICWLGLGEN